jgi:hypothetical protein
MKKLLIAASVVCLSLMAAPAMALDSMKGFKLDSKPTINPVRMTCDAFVDADENLQLLVAAWWDGSSSTGQSIRNVKYSETDVAEMHEKLLDGCDDDPDATLDDITFIYGTDETLGKPTCRLLAKMPDVFKASQLLAWTIGYIHDEFGGKPQLDVAGFAKFGDEIFKMCKSDQGANLIELVMENLGIEE